MTAQNLASNAEQGCVVRAWFKTWYITLIATGNLFSNVEVDNCFCKLKINQFQFDSRLLI